MHQCSMHASVLCGTRLNEKSVLEEPIINDIARQHSATAAQVLLVSRVVANQCRIEF